MSVTLDEARRIAALARLSFGENELSRMADDLERILAHFETLSTVDTEGVEPAFRTLRRENVFRPDVVGEMLDSEEALANAPDSLDGWFRVPAFLPGPRSGGSRGGRDR